jgi:polyisoprenoid-binding protein YceI
MENMMHKYTFILATILSLVVCAGVLHATSQETKTESTSDNSGPQIFDVDSVHSSTTFRVHHLGAGMFYGRFNDVTGTIQYDPEQKKGLQFNIEVDVNSVDSGHPDLDGHLKSPDFFNAVEFPKMSFKSTGATMDKDADNPDGDTYRVEGNLTIHGITKKVTIEAVEVGHRTTRRGERIGFECFFTIKRSEFEMPYGIEGNRIGDKIRIIVSLEATAR